MSDKKRVVGIVRFSVLSTKESPFKIYQKADFDEIRQAVLDEERLKQRFLLFETICLPSLDAQSCNDFAIVVVAPRLLPQVWKHRLGALSRERPWMHVYYAHEKNFVMSMCSEFILEEILDTNDTFYTFRLDDDDALSCDFVERVHRYLRPHFAGLGLSYCRGFFLDISGGEFRIKPKVVPNIAVGFGYIGSSVIKRTLFDVSELHHRSHHRFPVITDATRNTFVAVTHATNDSGDARKLNTEATGAEAAGVFLRQKGFNVELELLSWLQREGSWPNRPALNPEDFREDPTPALDTALLALRKLTKQEKINQDFILKAHKASNNTNSEAGGEATVSKIIGGFLSRFKSRIA